MDYTTNFHLPQWQQNDRILMDDFNQFAACLESALTQNQEAAETAQTTADQALQTANEVKARSRLIITCGSYRGTGGSKTINTGYWPMAVFVLGEQDPNASPRWFGHRDFSAFFINGGDTPYSAVTTDSFTVREPTVEGYPNLNKAGHSYYYVSIHT